MKHNIKCYDYKFLKKDTSYQLPIVHSLSPTPRPIVPRKSKKNLKQPLLHIPNSPFNRPMPSSIVLEVSRIETPPTPEESLGDITPTLRVLTFPRNEEDLNIYQLKIPQLQSFKRVEPKCPTKKLVRLPAPKKHTIKRTKHLPGTRDVRSTLVDEFYQVLRQPKRSRVQDQDKLNRLVTILQEPLALHQRPIVIFGSDSALESSGDSMMIYQSSYFDDLKIKRVRICLVQFLKCKLKRLQLTPRMLIQTQIFSKTPHSKEGSMEFFRALKRDDIQTIKVLLGKCKYLVYDYDNAHLTGLHWAAKRGQMDIAKLLIQHLADVDAEDIVHRTPLYLAAQNDHIQIAQLLLYNQANPWSNDYLNYSEVIKTPMMKSLFATSRKVITQSNQIHILLTITSPQMREAIWNKEAPAMSVIKNIRTSQQLKDLYNGNDYGIKYPQLDARLMNFYQLQSHQLLKKKGHDVQKVHQEIDRRIQKDLKMFVGEHLCH